MTFFLQFDRWIFVIYFDLVIRWINLTKILFFIFYCTTLEFEESLFLSDIFSKEIPLKVSSINSKRIFFAIFLAVLLFCLCLLFFFLFFFCFPVSSLLSILELSWTCFASIFLVFSETLDSSKFLVWLLLKFLFLLFSLIFLQFLFRVAKNKRRMQLPCFLFSFLLTFLHNFWYSCPSFLWRWLR